MSVRPVDRGQALFDSIPPPPFDVLHPRSGRLIARVSESTIVIRSKLTKKYIYEEGINIPPFLREKFNNMNGVSADHPFFYQAFITAQCWHFLREGYKIEPGQDTISTESSNQG